MTLTGLLLIVAFILVGCLLTWAVMTYVPLPDVPKKLICGIVWVLILIKVLNILGLV